jgi:RimJ/RimL family protein N-acetyltransferase
MTFEHTADYGMVEMILTNPRCYRMMVSDLAPPRAEFRMSGGNYTPILCRADDGLILGMFLLVPLTGQSAEVHLCFVPSAWGQVEEAGKQFLAWIWRETHLQTLLGPVPSYNRLALRVAKACGFREAYTEKVNATRDNAPFERIVTRISRPASELTQ